jgi:hypothetical protein
VSDWNDLRDAMNQLVGVKCWSVIAGAGTGSAVHFALGSPVPRAHPLRNPNLSELQRTHKGEFSLFVQCAWRLEARHEVLCGSTDDDANSGSMVAGLAQLVGKWITAIAVSRPIPDATVNFSDGMCLRVFCDQTNLDLAYPNYSVGNRDVSVVVGARGVIHLEQKSSDSISQPKQSRYRTVRSREDD